MNDSLVNYTILYILQKLNTSTPTLPLCYTVPLLSSFSPRHYCLLTANNESCHLLHVQQWDLIRNNLLRLVTKYWFERPEF